MGPRVKPEDVRKKDKRMGSVSKNMTIRIGINGLGRIGRCVMRALIETGRKDIEIVALNGPAPIETHIHLLKYDSVHGAFRGEVKADKGGIDMGRGVMRLTHERDI